MARLIFAPYKTASQRQRLVSTRSSLAAYLFEAAVAAGVQRLVFASSAQTIESYPVDRLIAPVCR